MANRILVTGATGNIASLVIPVLKDKGVTVRALVHDAEKGKALEAEGVEVVVGDFDTPELLDEAFKDVDTVLMIAPPHPEAGGWMTNLIAAAKRADGPRVVRMSALNADPDGPTLNTQQHGTTDQELEASGLQYTILRPHFFMQNFFMSAPTIGSDGAMYWGMGDGRLGMVDVRDIADVAIEVLTDEAHNGKTYTLTGPASITLEDVASSVGTAVGKDVKYVPVSVEQVEEAVLPMMGEWGAKIMGQYSKAYSENWGDFTTAAVKDITGHEPRSIDDFANEVLAPALSG